MAIARTSSAPGPAQRGVDALRAGRRPRDRRAGRPPLRRAAGAVGRHAWPPAPVDERGNLPDRVAGARCAPTGSTRLLGTDLGGRRRSPTLLEPDRLRRRRRRRRRRACRTSSCRRFRPDTTTETDVIEEVARHHGYSRIPRTVPPAVRTGALTAAPARPPARSARCWSGSASTRPCRCRSSRPATSSRAGLPGDARHRHQPARRRGVACCARRCGPGCSRRSPTTRRTATPASRLFEIGKVFRPPAAGPAAARRARAPRRRPRRRRRHRRRSRSGRCWPTRSALPTAAASSRSPSPGCTPPGRPRSCVGADGTDRVGAVGEIDPAVLDAFGIAERVGLARGRPRPPARPAPRRPRRTARSAATRRATSTWPSRSTTTVPAAGSRRTIRAAAGDAARRPRLFDVYRGAPVSPTAAAAWPTACASRPPDRTLTDADIASHARRRGHRRRVRGRGLPPRLSLGPVRPEHVPGPRPR